MEISINKSGITLRRNKDTTTKRTTRKVNRDGSTTTTITTDKKKRRMRQRAKFKIIEYAFKGLWNIIAICIVAYVFLGILQSKPKCTHQQIVTSREMIEAIDSNNMSQVNAKIQNGDIRQECK